jgi:ornithine cyclodeaminase/alanine dehydrogenase-like protein (mu-crystallin family)
MLTLERGRQLLYLSRSHVAALEVSPDEVREAVEAAFREKAAGRVEMPPKPGIHTSGDAFIHAMPAYLPALGAAGLKWVSGYPENRRFGLPYITGLLVLNCPETGVPLAVMDCTWITEKRTAAATAVAVGRLAAEDARRLAIIGAGVQGRANTDALRRVCPGLRDVAAYDPSDEARRVFEREVCAWDLWVEQAKSPQEAVNGADIVVTCAPIVKHPEPVIPPEWLKPGSVVASLDFDATVMASVAQAADGMWVDDGEQFEYYRGLGHFAGMPENYQELATLVATGPGRRAANDRYLVVNLGLALEDMATARLLYRRALERHVGTVLPC